MISFRIYDVKLLEKFKTTWTKIEELKNIELNTLPVYDDRCIKTKIRRRGDKVYVNLGVLNMPKDDRECYSFTIIPTDSILSSIICKYI